MRQTQDLTEADFNKMKRDKGRACTSLRYHHFLKIKIFMVNKESVLEENIMHQNKISHYESSSIIILTEKEKQ